MSIAVLIAVNTLFVVGPMNLADLLETHEYHYGEQHQQHLLRYQLFVPRSVRPMERYPLLVWLYHDEIFHLEHPGLVLKDIPQIKKYRFFMVAIPRASQDANWFHTIGALNFSAADAALAFEIVRKTMKEHPVDHNRVYLTGVSGGGTRCWQMAVSYPDLFAAVVPTGSAGTDVSFAPILAHIPVWAFHNIEDSVTPRAGVERTVAAVKHAGGNAQLTIIQRPGHDCWNDAFGQFDAMTWMQAQRRGDWYWTPIGCRPWQWWHILAIPCAFLVFVRVTWYIEQRRRRHKASSVAPEAEKVGADFAVDPLLLGEESTSQGSLICEGSSHVG